MKALIFQKSKLLKEVCTLGIGGPARYFVEVHSVEQAVEALSFAKKKKLPFHILGKGSNTLFDDLGFNGVVISNKIDFFEKIGPGTFHVGAGYSFSLLGVQTARQGWTGLEFASGIPASVGGAVFMNAGANGSETAESLESVDFLTIDGVFQVLPRAELNFSYRTSPFHHQPGIIVGATFKLSPLPGARQKQLQIIDYRKKTQPYGDKSAGCIFRNPPHASAGALIEQTGLKGIGVGGAKVSQKHANFLINAKDSTCSDLQALIALVRQRVKEQSGIELECEVRFIASQENHE